MARDENFFSRLRELVEECRDALGPTGEVKDPLEYRFEALVGNRRFAFQGLPEEWKVLVGEESGHRGVVWFDELKFDSLTSGWGTRGVSAWDFMAGLSDLPAMAEPAEGGAESAAAGQGARPVGRGVRGVTRLLTGIAYAGAAWRSVRSVARENVRPRLRMRGRKPPTGGDAAP